MADSTSLGDLLAGIGAGQAVVNRPALSAAVQQGQALAGLRTEQTENAMLTAQRMREEQDASDSLEDTLVNSTDANGKAMMTPSQAKFTATQMKFLHGGAMPALQALQESQKLTNVSTLSDPNAQLAARVAAAQANAGKFDVGQTSNVGDQLVNNVDPNALAPGGAGPQVIQTPVSAANIADKTATTNLHNQEANSPELFHPTGANNPLGLGGHGGAAGTGPGAITKRYMAATGTAAEQLGVEVNNILHIPWGSTSGVLGIGGEKGGDLMSTPIASLKNAMSSENTQLYAQAAANIGRLMATVEKGGRPVTAPEGDAAAAAFTIRPGDTEMTKLQKLASLSAHAQATLKSYVKFYANDMDDDQKQYFNDLSKNFGNMIPFTLDDVAALKNATDKPGAHMNTYTVGQFLMKHGMNTLPPGLATPNAPPGTSPAAAGPAASSAPVVDHSALWN